jgi:hypothetical protein
MTISANVLEREDAVVADDGAWRLGLVFEPETFFLGRTEGAGVVRDPFGRIVRRCHITTTGAFDTAQHALRFDEVFVYDDGETDTWRWVMQPGRDGRYIAAESKAGTGLYGERQGEDYVISFRRPVGRARGPLSPHYRLRLTLLAPNLAIKRADISLLGAPRGSLSAFHRRVPT